MGKPLIALAFLALLSVTPASAIDLDDVIGMLDANVSEEVILRVIDAEGERFYLTSDDVLDLIDAGASDWFLEEMLDRSERPRREHHGGYDLNDPYRTYVTIGLVYDPFDYYFVTWPYYYAYVSPFRFSWTWWYYGGPYHNHWWGPECWRWRYYDDAWGCRTIWDRGYRDRQYHVPRYDLSEKQVRRAVYDRSAGTETKAVRNNLGLRRNVYDRAGGERKVSRSGARDRRVRAEGEPRSNEVWGRKEQRERSRTEPAKPSRPEIRTQQPPRGSTPPPRSEIRPQRPSRDSSTPARPSRSTGGTTQAPSRPSRHR